MHIYYKWFLILSVFWVLRTKPNKEPKFVKFKNRTHEAKLKFFWARFSILNREMLTPTYMYLCINFISPIPITIVMLVKQHIGLIVFLSIIIY